jgi:hypothetical protein
VLNVDEQTLELIRRIRDETALARAQIVALRESTVRLRSILEYLNATEPEQQSPKEAVRSGS